MKIVDLFRKFLLYLLKLVNGPEEESPALPASNLSTITPVDAGGSVSPSSPATSPPEPSATTGTRTDEPVLARTGEIVDTDDVPASSAVAKLGANNLLAAISAVEEDPIQVATSSPEVREIVPVPSRLGEPEKPNQHAAFTILEPGIATVPVRRFFSRLTARDAAVLSEKSWATLPVERFFLALSNPPLMVMVPRGRGPAIEAPKAIDETFAEFVWD